MHALTNAGASALAALRSIAETKGMRAIAEETGLSRETLYRTLCRVEIPPCAHLWP